MKNVISNLSLSILTLLQVGTLVSCDQKSPDSPEKSDKAFANQEGILQLNNGFKWKANAETTLGVEELKGFIQAFDELKVPDDLDTYNQLGEAMHETMKTIFANCTMTGDAHNELHDFLYPMMGDIKKLQGDDLSTAKQSLESLRKQLAKYTDYFE